MSAAATRSDSADPDIALYVGGHANSIQGEKADLRGHRCFTPIYSPPKVYDTPAGITALLDSGAFSDAPEDRLSPSGALERQLKWEAKAAQTWHGPWISHALVSYDLLIDEVWTNGVRKKSRWSVDQAEAAVEQTIDAARYLALRRDELAPRRLVLACQGVDAPQYTRCVEAVLETAAPRDWLGIGGWCILGRFTSWMPEWWRMLRRVIPRIAASPITHVHIFGVTYLPALGGLLWLADRHGLTVSTDSTRPMLDPTRGLSSGRNKSGARCPYWRDNVEWWKSTLGTLRESSHYREIPPLQTRLF